MDVGDQLMAVTDMDSERVMRVEEPGVDLEVGMGNGKLMIPASSRPVKGQGRRGTCRIPSFWV